MRISHRGRLTLTISAFAGAVLAGLFVLAMLIFGKVEEQRAHDLLRAPLRQINEIVVTQDTLTPDVGEIVNANPQLSFCVFDLNGVAMAASGPLSLDSTFRWAYSTIGKASHQSGVVWGFEQIANNDVIIGSISTPKGLIVGVVSWSERERTMAIASWALFGLWFPLVGLIAGITWIASARTFLPLASMTEQAEFFSESDLTRRLLVESNDEFGQFAGRLNSFLDRLEDSVLRHKQFIEDAAHELRTPLTILRGRMETALLSPRTGDEYRHTLQEILRETERMSRLVEAMLQSALPVLEISSQLDLADTLERTHARWLDRYIESGVQLDLEVTDAKIVALEEEVISVVDNLLTNALRASPKESTCTLALTIEGDHALMTVSDEGEGVPVDKREAIFDRFTRLEKSRNRSLGGFGVGLAVSRRLVEGRGGTIGVTDSPSGGARFEVRWPLAG